MSQERTQLNIRLSREEFDLINQIAADLRQETGARTTQSDVVRLGLRALADARKKKKAKSA